MIKFDVKKGLNNIKDAKIIREKVFMEEQGFKNEFDDIDSIAYHVVVYIDDIPVACGRTFPKENDSSTYIFGRIATLKQQRGKHLASKVMYELEKTAQQHGAKTAELSAQCTAQPFYEKLGYQSKGEIYLDEHCPHITMVKSLG